MSMIIGASTTLGLFGRAILGAWELSGELYEGPKHLRKSV